MKIFRSFKLIKIKVKKVPQKDFVIIIITLFQVDKIKIQNVIQVTYTR